MATYGTNIVTDEKTYQEIFYGKLGILDDVTIARSTDGYMDGTIFEHKQNATAYGRSKALSQVLIYLTRFNRDGMEIPKNIAIVSQNESKVYFYDSNDYLDVINDIPTYANMSPSKGIDGFAERKAPKIIKYDLNNAKSCTTLLRELQHIGYAKVDITEHNVYGWASRYYSDNPKKRKNDMFDELESPKVYADYINPWNGKPEDFSLIMDLLNDPQQQKKAGAYYTPPEYADLALEMVRKAIKEVPKEKDYIIIDRCAGTGALELGLTDEELSHVILSTYELKEWHALKDRFGNRVKYIKPPIPAGPKVYPDYDKDGFLIGANAMTEVYFNDNNIMKYIRDKEHYSIILYENPPYSDDSGSATETGRSRGNSAENEFMVKSFNAAVPRNVSGLVSSKDTANLFIWSGFQYYLRDEHDSYILFSPIKYWKTAHLVNKQFREGYLLNREYFHANASAISLIKWDWTATNIPVDNLELQPMDIKNRKVIKAYFNDSNGNKVDANPIIVHKVFRPVNQYLFDKREKLSDTEDGIWCQSNGKEGEKTSSTGTKNIFNKDIIGYLYLVGFSFHQKHLNLTRSTLNLRKNGFYLRTDIHKETGNPYALEALPLFCAKAYPQDVWYYTDVFSTCADSVAEPELPRNDKTVPPRNADYQKDNVLLKRCLIFTCLTSKNKCRSFKGTDGRTYQNELCFDKGTWASKELKRLTMIAGNELTDEEQSLIKGYKNILKYIKTECTENNHPEYNDHFYDANFKWGLFQINDEINVQDIVGHDRKGKEIKAPRYGDLNNKLSAFQKAVNRYYRNNLACGDSGILFDYSLIK